MDILLTHDQQGDAIDEALKRCVADKELSPAHEIAAESCRAQVRKVVEWAEGECKHDSKRIRRCCDLCWRDVRAAGEEK